MMREKPILFNTDMVKAILDGMKTATRRVVKHNALSVLNSPYHAEHPEVPDKVLIEKLCMPPYKPGDILYVREAWSTDVGGIYIYKADYKEAFTNHTEINAIGENIKWRPSIHMPKEAARIWLRVTDIGVERLQDIVDCTEEGITRSTHASAHMNDYDERCEFKALWDSTIKKYDLAIYGWDANPYVWRIAFERCEKPKGDN